MNVSLVSLWLPILLSGVVVFFASSAMHVLLTYHNKDWQRMPDEDAARAALKGTPLGQYFVPHAADNAERNSEEWQRKFKEGPAVMITVMQHGDLKMMRQMTQWFVFCIVMSVLVAYLASITLAQGAEYLAVFRVVGTAAFLGYAGSIAISSIWFGYTWSKTSKEIIDGLVYALITAGMFGWLWP